MRKQLPLLVLLLLPFILLAQNVTVPKNVYFADVHLKISDGAQQEIQKKVDALHRNKTYFQKKVDLADAYFPIIERVFKEEGVPDDFKYLALQESGLIGDAISTSNAVGYWQFKKEAAMDFNLKMDNVVDERRHIIEASRGAAKYFKRSNSNYDNWFTSLLSYYLGYSGVKTYSSPSDKGAKKMEINEKSHPYVITFLAHKIAYDNFVGKSKPMVSLQAMRAKPGQSLSDIALSTKTDYAELDKYNKWLLGNSIPSDKDYYVLVPVRDAGQGLLASTTTTPASSGKHLLAAAMVKRNGLNALIARPDDTKDKLALQAGISTRKFLKYNDMHNFDPIIEGSAYYIEKKNLSTEKEYHVVQPGETMQMISQHYGVRLTYLLFKNRMSRTEVPIPGRVLWLQKRRPGNTPIEVRDLKEQQPAASAKTPVKESTETQTDPQSNKEEKAANENIFTRFINSFKRFKKDPEPKVTQESQPVIENKTETFEGGTPKAGVSTESKSNPALYPLAKDKVATDQSPIKAVKTEETKTIEKATAEEEDEIEAILKEDLSVDEKPKKNSPTKEASASTKSESSKTESAIPGTSQTNATRHTVKQGETLYSISRMYAVSVSDLTTWNKLGDEPLKIGQELLIAEPLITPATSGKQAEPKLAPQASVNTHTVTSGETLYQISKTYNVSLENLRIWNNLSDNSIKLGQELKVKAPANVTVTEKADETDNSVPVTLSGNTYHTVAGGESMYQISRKYGVTIKDIMEWNNKSDFSVSVGEKLLIKKK